MGSDDGAPESLGEIGGYQLRRVLGTGGMGTVYEATDGAGASVALKVLHPAFAADRESRERLRREVATLHRVRGAQVSQVIDAEVESMEAFIVTELIRGEALDDSVRTHGPLDASEVADLGGGLATALQQIHAVGVVHRDLKPSNVMLTESGPVLIDFGISQLVDDARITRAGLVTGTPGYVDPLVLTGAAPDQLGDWWGWAALLVFAATGREPFGRGPTVLTRAQTGQVDVEGLPDPLARVLVAALNPDPQLRLPPAAVVGHLSEIAAGRHISMPAAPPAGPPQPELSTERPGRPPPSFPPGTAPARKATRDDLVESWPELSTPVAEPVRAYVDQPYVAFGPTDVGAPGLRPAPARPLLTTIAWLVLSLIGVRWAGAAVVALTVALIATGTWGWGEQRLRNRRVRHGRRRRDTVFVWLAGPGHLMAGLVTALPGLIAGAVVGLGTWLVAVQFLDEGVAAGLAVALMAFVAWFVPSAGAAREGTRRGWAWLTPSSAAGAAVTVIAVLALLAVAVWAFGSGYLDTADWTPFPVPTP